jgi:hypothetical protein
VSNTDAKGGAGAPPPRPAARARGLDALLVLGASVLAALMAEPLLRLRYAEPVPPTPPAVLEVQPWLRLDPVAGYTWKPGISVSQDVLFHNADVEYEALSTDEFGIENPAEAIAARSAGSQVQVLGLGDSFMEMAGHEFHTAFAERGRMYYSLAVHRHAPPQYAALFEAYGIAMKPEIVLLGLFENDFAETEDFEKWKASGMDWFAYHSGTWCGRPVPATASRRFIRTWFRGYEGLANVLRVRLRGERMSLSGPTARQVERVGEYLSKIARLTHDNGSVFWIVLIPSKPTARGETTAEARAYDRVVAALDPGAAGLIDLRPVFQAQPDPASLYYREDGHWNRAGIALAAQVILDKLSLAQSAGANPAAVDPDEPRIH